MNYPRPLNPLLAALVLFSVPVALTVACGSIGDGDSDGSGTSGSSGNTFGGDNDASGSTRPCEGLECQQVVCENGGTTSLSGTVYAPNGTLPLYNAIVYVPNAPVEPFPTTGVTCDVCGTSPSGRPIATALTDPHGKFTLTNVPVGENIPLVIQIGKWRRQITVPSVARCTDTPLAAVETRLPRNQSEGDIPKVALTTGGADSLECFFRKLGVDQSEFTTREGTGRIHLYNGIRRDARCQRWTTQGRDRWVNRDWDECTADRINKAPWSGTNPPNADNQYRIVATNNDGVDTIKAFNGKPAATLPPATDLWGSTSGGSSGFSCAANGFTEGKRCTSSSKTWQATTNRLKDYDMVVLSCEGAENNGTKDDGARAALRDYMSAGGRVFNSHFHYTWFKNPDNNPLQATATWVNNSDRGDRTTRIDTSFAKGQAFGEWLVAADAATVDGSGNTNSEMTQLRKNVSSVASSSRRWIYEPGDNNAVKFYSFNMPLGSAAEAQCGRAVYTDIHVSSGDASGGTFPDNCTTLQNGLSNQEKALLFLMMDLSSCIQDDSAPPAAPPPVVK
ncbi:MAG TPA: carboxypeptidase regulatory-like domain-containing protein [Labilithrix sp.]|nr:carboxypeptidase regulatory-like domain-containing protein [Labilithrix sp.]